MPLLVVRQWGRKSVAAASWRQQPRACCSGGDDNKAAAVAVVAAGTTQHSVWQRCKQVEDGSSGGTNSERVQECAQGGGVGLCRGVPAYGVRVEGRPVQGKQVPRDSCCEADEVCMHVLCLPSGTVTVEY